MKNDHAYRDAEDYYDMAVEWLDRGNTEKAIANLKEAISLNPHFIYAYISLAKAHAMEKHYPEAVHTLKKASKQDPSFHRLHYLMAKYAYKGGNFPLAIRHIDEAIALSPEKLYFKVKSIIEKAMRAMHAR